MSKSVLKIGTDEKAKSEFLSRMREKILAFTTIKQECDKHKLKYDLEALYNNPEKEFDNAIDKTFNTGVLKQLSTRKRKELFEVDTNIVGKSIAVYNRHTDLDFSPETFEFDTPSFDTIIEGDKTIKDYESCMKAIEMLESLGGIVPLMIQRGTKARLILNMKTNKLEPNINLLKENQTN